MVSAMSTPVANASPPKHADATTIVAPSDNQISTSNPASYAIYEATDCQKVIVKTAKAHNADSASWL
jgi:hypothetical protein